MKTPPNRLMVRLFRAGLGRIAGKEVLLMTTKGRKSGRPHTVAVQYEKIDGKYYIGAAGGINSDWFRNIQVRPRVGIEVGKTQRDCLAEVVTDPERIADFLIYRLKKHPIMLRLILKMDGMPFSPTREMLLEYSKKLGMVILSPEKSAGVSTSI